MMKCEEGIPDVQLQEYACVEQHLDRVASLSWGSGGSARGGRN